MPITAASRFAERKFQERLADANERHARGDIEPELAARLTKPKEAETLYQVFADIQGEEGSRPLGPKFAGDDGKEACLQVVEAINAQICQGRFKTWGNIRVEALVPTKLN